MPTVPRALLLAAALVGVAVLGTGAAAAASADEVPRGTAVRDVDLGGLTRSEAAERLDGSFPTERTTPVSLLAGDEVLPLDPVRAGLQLDVPATVDEAMDVGWADRLRALAGAERDVAPVPAVDEAALGAALGELAASFDREPREGSIAFTESAEPVVEQPVVGRQLDVTGAAAAVREAYLAPQVEVPVAVTEVQTTPAEVQEAVEAIAEPAMAAPITVDVEGDELVVEPVDLAPALTVRVSDGKLVPQLDGAVLRERLTGRLVTVGQPATDASFDVSSGTPVVVPSKPGRSVSADDLRDAVLTVLTAEAPRRASAPLSESAPRLTTEAAAGLGVREVIGTYTSKHPCCAPRVRNIQTIADIVDGHVLRPGEEFDLNAHVGPRDRARGFVEAPQILEGQFVDSVGGGVSQFATAVFNAVFFSGLEDVTHTPHSYWIKRYPPGREATVSYPLPDLIFRNDSPHGVLIDTSHTSTSVTVTLWGTRRFDEIRSVTGPKTRLRDFETEYVDRPDCTPTSGEQGFDITVTRVFVVQGEVVRREPFDTRYKPEPRFICGKPPPPPAPSPPPSEVPAPPPAADAVPPAPDAVPPAPAPAGG